MRLQLAHRIGLPPGIQQGLSRNSPKHWDEELGRHEPEGCEK
jgi:hypothetical protein